MNENIKVLLLDLPCSVRGFVLVRDDVYTIVLNARLNNEQNQKTLKHELKHISEGHLDREINVQEVECLLHGVGRERHM